MDQNVQTQAIVDSEGISPLQEAKISKNQLKKQLKREKWLATKQHRRRHIKENRKRRLAEMRDKGEDTGPTRKSLKTNTMKNSSCKIKVVLDLSFDEYMVEKDVNSLTCQLQHSYSANRRAENPLQLYLCSLGGKTKQRLDEIGDYKGWDVHVETIDYEQIFPKDSLIYLSSESPNILTNLSEDKVYIIGGLVDHNKHKGLCHKIAEERGIAHAQLPIAEYLDMKTRRVLAVNHVFSILLRFTETNDWRTAFLAEMPQRKQAHIKEKGAESVTNHTSDTVSVGVDTNNTDSLVVNYSRDVKSDLCTDDVPLVSVGEPSQKIVAGSEFSTGNQTCVQISDIKEEKAENTEQISDKEADEKVKTCVPEAMS